MLHTHLDMSVSINQKICCIFYCLSFLHAKVMFLPANNTVCFIVFCRKHVEMVESALFTNI